jgi:hypothetical protein
MNPFQSFTFLNQASLNQLRGSSKHIQTTRTTSHSAMCNSFHLHQEQAMFIPPGFANKLQYLDRFRFGVMKAICQRMRQVSGINKWWSPQVLANTNRKYGLRKDVFSFGMLLLDQL